METQLSRTLALAAITSTFLAGSACGWVDLTIFSGDVKIARNHQTGATLVTVTVTNTGLNASGSFDLRLGVSKTPSTKTYIDLRIPNIAGTGKAVRSMTFAGTDWKCAWGNADVATEVAEFSESNNYSSTNEIWKVIPVSGLLDDIIAIANPGPAPEILQLNSDAPFDWTVIFSAPVVPLAPEECVDIVVSFEAPPGFSGYQEINVIGEFVDGSPGVMAFNYHLFSQPTVVDTVVCEPQGGTNPEHPTTYWYDVTPGANGRCDFHVRVFDGDPGNYTNPSLPTANWQFSVHPVGEEWWASWWDPTCTDAIFSTFRFQFTNPNQSTWAHWTTTIDASPNPYGQVVDTSVAHSTDPDGLGYRVHSPFAEPCHIGPWIEDFDDYDTVTPLPDQSSWEAWDDDPGAADFYASTAQSHSSPNSVAIDNGDDAVHRHTGYTSGPWLYSAWQFIPPGMDDLQYFILLNTYPASDLPDWSMQIECDGAANLIRDFNGDASLPMVKGEWAHYIVFIDLDLDTQSVFYNNQHLVTKSWTAGVAPGGALNIAAVDLWANDSAHEVYYDDLSLTRPELYLDGPEHDPFLRAGDPTGPWHELWPDYCTPWDCVAWIDLNQNGKVDPGEYVSLIRGRDEPEWWQVEVATITVTLELDAGEEPMFLDWAGDVIADPFNPIGPWQEVYPNFDTPWECIDWIDNGSGILDFCDWLVFDTAFGLLELHVIEVAPDLVVIPVPVLPDLCPADITGPDSAPDGVVNVLDLLAVLSAWGQTGDVPEDINGDSIVDVLDLLAVLSAWGPCP